MAHAEPSVGALYSCKEQSRMHGGSLRSTLPESGGTVTLIRFRRDKNPGGPQVIEHGDEKRLEERIEMLRDQGDQREKIPVYEHVSSGAWKCLGFYRVRSITDDAREVAERSKARGAPIRYVIRLEEAR